MASNIDVDVDITNGVDVSVDTSSTVNIDESNVGGPKGERGSDGKNGEDGFSPVANVSRISGGARITVIDRGGTTTADVLDGERGERGSDGKDGTDGKDGSDGLSPTASVDRTSGGARITIIDKNGTTTAEVLDGEKGERGEPGRDGSDGRDGKDGSDGKNGVSPTASVNRTSGGATITITDKDGTTTADILDGEKGEKGDPGTAAYTAGDGIDIDDDVVSLDYGEATVGNSTPSTNFTLEALEGELLDLKMYGDTEQAAFPSPGYPQEVKTVSGEQVITVNGAAHTIDLGAIELCKIGDYQDYIYKQNGAWYVHKETGSIPVAGLAGTGRTYDNAVYYRFPRAADSHNYMTFKNEFVYCSCAIYLYTWDYDDPGCVGKIMTTAGNDRYWIGFPVGTTLTQAQELTAGAVVLYALAAATDTEITNTALIEQLEAVMAAGVETGENAITVSGDLPGPLAVEAYANALAGRLKQLEDSEGGGSYTLPVAGPTTLGGVKVGENLAITPGGTLSATDTTYSAGSNVSIEDGVISAADTTYKAGTNVTISNGTISGKDTTYTAGSNVSISNGVISATDTTYKAGKNITISGNEISAADTKNIIIDVNSNTDTWTCDLTFAQLAEVVNAGEQNLAVRLSSNSMVYKVFSSLVWPSATDYIYVGIVGTEQNGAGTQLDGFYLQDAGAVIRATDATLLPGGCISTGTITGATNSATSASGPLALNTIGTPNLRDSAVTASKIDLSTLIVATSTDDTLRPGSDACTLTLPSAGSYYVLANTGINGCGVGALITAQILLGDTVKATNYSTGVGSSSASRADSTVAGVITGAKAGDVVKFRFSGGGTTAARTTSMFAIRIS